MHKVLGNWKAIVIFMLPAVFFFLFIIAAPVFMSTWYSLLDWTGLGQGKFIGVHNYIELFTNKIDKFPAAAVHSFWFLIVSVFIELPISLALALLCAGGAKGENFFRTVYFLPVIISTVVIGQLWMKIYNPDYGLLNVFLRAVGLKSWARPWLGDMNTVLISTFIPTLWQYVGYHMLLMYAAIKSISPEIFEAAKIDGATGVQTAFRISIPMIKPMLKVSVTFSVIGALKVFDLVYVLTNGGPVHASEVPSTLMVTTIFRSYRYGFGSSMAIFIIVECMLATIIVNWVFKALHTDEMVSV